MVLAAQTAVEASPLSPIDRPIPEPGPGEARVHVRACGACRTDIHVVEGDLPARRLPLIPGHQVVGTVDSLGPGAARFRIGDRVGIAWLRSTCGRCRFCLSGRENLCADCTYTGWTHDGGYAEYACVPEAFAYAIPPALDDAEAAPLLCAGIIGYRALRRSQVPRGRRLGLYGFGSPAHITLKVARHWGCAVWVATREPPASGWRSTSAPPGRARRAIRCPTSSMPPSSSRRWAGSCPSPSAISTRVVRRRSRAST
jgi:propanol-preferring alcohol dehydrogenase